MTKLFYDSTKNRDLFYMVRLEVPDPFFFLDAGERKYAFLDHRELGAFQEQNRNPAVEAVLLNPLLEEAKKMQEDTSVSNRLALLLLEKYGGGLHVEVPTRFPLPMADFLRQKGIQLLAAASMYPERTRKSAEEVQAIRDTVAKTENAFSFIEAILKHSVIEGNRILYQGAELTSEFLKKTVEFMLLEQNLVSEEGMIISTGKQTAIPHHRGAGPLLAHQPIVCDVFPKDRTTGYVADLTRTFVKGEPSEALQKMQEAVLHAQERGIASMKPGAQGKEVHEACAEALADAGYEEGFLHSAGHGIGLEMHELPTLGPSSEEELQPGNVVTVEPGVYYPDIGGIRIEDDVLVTEDGYEMLSRYPKERWIIP